MRLLRGVWLIAIGVTSFFLFIRIGVGDARAAYITVYGGPEYDPASFTGYVGLQPQIPGHSVNNSGTAVGSATKSVSGVDQGGRAVRWDGSGNTTELGHLGTTAGGRAESHPYECNDSGTVVGRAYKYVSGTFQGDRAVRWDAAGNATELGLLGTNAIGVAYSTARAVNDSGTAVGDAEKYVLGSYKGQRAVRWDAEGTAATELDFLTADANGYTLSYAFAVNASGTAVGNAGKYVAGAHKGQRAVRWDASGTAATELGHLGTDASGYTESRAVGVNANRTAVGWAEKYVSGVDKGARAVRWDASGTAATELGHLGTDAGGYTVSQVYAVNASGTVVGYARNYISGADQNDHAVAWGSDGLAIDLNALIDPTSGWLLTVANSISDTGWISGRGWFDPDGRGPLNSYQRLFVMQLVPIPEPGALLLGMVAGVGLLLSRGRRP